MIELVAFPDVEALLVDHVRDELAARDAAATVATRVPNPRPNRLVRVTRIGGPRSSLITDSPMVTFECWDETSMAASGLARLVRSLVWAMEGRTIGGEWIYRVRETGGPAYFPDPGTDLPRYQFTTQLRVRGKAIP